MRTAQSALTIGLAAALLVGCGGSQPLIGTPGATRQAPALAARNSSTNYKVLYSFGAPPDGNSPRAGLIDVGGTLYGTTSGGGSHSCYVSYGDLCGTVFSITTGASEQVLHSFGYGTDGASPTASLIEVNGTLYGTTRIGGSHDCPYSIYLTCGTVFAITTGGTENVLHSFDAYARDGAEPEASLIDVKGTLYGTTAGGGANHCGLAYTLCGTVFSMTADGTEQVLHSFKGTDGAAPKAGLIYVRGTLYGTTFYGGKDQRGTVFRITLGGRETVLHSFGKGTDGSNPEAGLIDVAGTLYGTTAQGGAYGHGTVFSITAGGTEKVLQTFDFADGCYPSASLIELQGKLYGTTQCGGNYGKGTVFSITPAGKEKVLHSFGGGSDGAQPFAALIDVNGTLYGTTAGGGTSGYGTVFALTP